MPIKPTSSLAPSPKNPSIARSARVHLVALSVSCTLPSRPLQPAASRHGLVDGLHTIAHGKFIHNLLGCLIIVNLPGVITLGIWDLHNPIVLHVCHEVEQVLPPRWRRHHEKRIETQGVRDPRSGEAYIIHSFIHSFICLFFHPSTTYQFIQLPKIPPSKSPILVTLHPPGHPSIYLSIYSFTQRSSYPRIHLPTPLCFLTSFHPSISPSICLPAHSFIHPHTHPFIFPKSHPCTSPPF